LIKLLLYIVGLFEKYINILVSEMASPAGNPTVSAHFRFNLLTGKTDEQQESSRLAANGHNDNKVDNSICV